MRRKLKTDESGATILEFGLVAPVLSMLLIGSFDLAHTLYMQSVLQGALQKAARDSSLETGASSGTQTTIDTRVTNQVKQLMNGATVNFTRRYYKTFSKAAAAQAESFTDTNTNGQCDGGEPYVDVNNNNNWDRDGGDAGQGGARDNVVYTVDVSYPRMFPLDKMIGGSGTTRISATTVLSNQPYGNQAQYASPTVRNCT